MKGDSNIDNKNVFKFHWNWTIIKVPKIDFDNWLSYADVNALQHFYTVYEIFSVRDFIQEIACILLFIFLTVWTRSTFAKVLTLLIQNLTCLLQTNQWLLIHNTALFCIS